MVTFKLEGLEQTVQALGELPKATQRNTLRRVLTKAGDPVRAAMEAMAPRDSGFTAESFGLSPTLNPRNRRASRRENIDFAEIHVGTRRGSAAHLQEFGTVNQAAQPFLRPAWDSRKDQTMEIIKDGLAEEVKKAAARQARKAARLAAKG